MRKLLVATGNPGKLTELGSLLSELRVQLVSPVGLGLNLEIAEDGATYVENAIKKAVAFASASGCVSIADDTGLEVQALDGAPGLLSKRYVPGEHATDADRRSLLLRNLAGVPRPWLARFRAAVAIAVPAGKTHWTEGTCEGEIISPERGSGGFGYDAIFLVAGTGLTMAELDLNTKNRLSHRGQAVSRALPMLRELFP
jgi:XTP/dITP diphosphohydrolase